MIIVRLDERLHDRTTFDCAQESLNRFLRAGAGQDSRRDLSVTFVLTRERGSPVVAGYYTLLASVGRAEVVPDRRLPASRDIPVVLLGRLAVDRRSQGQGFGALLLFDVMSRVRLAATQIGFHALVVNALDDRARSFYMKYGFASLGDDPLHLYIPLGTIAMMGLEPPSA